MKNRKKLLTAAFVVYCAALVYITLLRYFGAVGLSGYIEKFQELGSVGFMSYGELLSMNSNFIPFLSIYAFITAPYKSAVYVQVFLVNIVGNLLLFLPWGMLLPSISEKIRSFKRFFIITTLVIVGIELVQLFALLGACDIEDYILNILGAAAGFAVNKKLRRTKI